MTTQTKTYLLLGSSGFIGQHVQHKLNETDHYLRTPNHQQVDFVCPDWDSITQLLQGVDVVINMVGVMSQNAALLEKVHHDTPKQIAILAKQMGVKCWINLSALGADANHKVAFVGSKGRGDSALLQLADDEFRVVIGRPSLVFGRGGASCEMFIKLARLPVLFMPNAGNYRIQPVHINDVAQGLFNLATKMPIAVQPIINFTGGAVCSVAEYIAMLREDIHHKGRLTVLPVPKGIAKAAVLLARPMSKGMISQDSLTLLEEESIADNGYFTQILEYSPLGYHAFVDNKSAASCELT